MYFDKAMAEHNDVKSKLKDLLGATDGKSIFTGELFSAYEICGPAPGIEEISKPITAYNKKQPKRENTVSRKRELPESDDDEDLVPLSKRKVKDKKKEHKFEKKSKCKSSSFCRILAQNFNSFILVSATDKAPSITSVSNVRPTESSSVGGLTVGTDAAKKKNPPIVDLTKDDNSDATEVSFNKLQVCLFDQSIRR